MIIFNSLKHVCVACEFRAICINKKWVGFRVKICVYSVRERQETRLRSHSDVLLVNFIML